MSERAKFEILCVTMNQHDFSKIKEMNIHSNVVFANQCDHTSYEELVFDEVHTARMVSTETRGVGVNRNIALMYGDAEFCLFADDDVRYVDNMEELVLNEFKSHPSADVFIFNLYTDSERRQKKYKKTRRVTPWERMPWGGFRVAVKLDAVRKCNVWFSTLFGGGCVFPSGEDSIWLRDTKRRGLKFYISKEVIGQVSFEKSTWFTGVNEKYYYGQGAYYRAMYKYSLSLWLLYFAFRTRKNSQLTFSERLRWMKYGIDGYDKMVSFSEYNEMLSD